MDRLPSVAYHNGRSRFIYLTTSLTRSHPSAIFTLTSGSPSNIRSRRDSITCMWRPVETSMWMKSANVPTLRARVRIPFHTEDDDSRSDWDRQADSPRQVPSGYQHSTFGFYVAWSTSAASHKSRFPVHFTCPAFPPNRKPRRISMEFEVVPSLSSAKGIFSGDSHLVYRISGRMWSAFRGMSAPNPATNPFLMYSLSIGRNVRADGVELLKDRLPIR